MFSEDQDEKGAFDALMDEIKQVGKPSWATFQASFVNVERIVRGRISTRLQSKVRASDIAQSALRSWISDLENGRIEIEGAELAILNIIVMNKIVEQIRKYSAVKRDALRETGIDLDSFAQALDLDSPEVESIANETEYLIDELIREESNEMQTAILLKAFDGWSSVQILEYLDSNGHNMSLRTLQLRFAKFKARVATRLKMNLD
ncbi:MAG TPA: hypothetical protein PKD54_10125 [Pirellulaceae bacterium]|nr:hypothetical protein [Pirellulaceae bacterium]